MRILNRRLQKQQNFKKGLERILPNPLTGSTEQEQVRFSMQVSVGLVLLLIAEVVIFSL